MRIVDIGPRDLDGVVKTKTGLAGVNSSVNGGSPVWSRLSQVGRSLFSHRGLMRTVENEEVEESGRVVRGTYIAPYNESLTFLIRQGGIKEEGLERSTIRIFREDVYPAIKSFIKDCPSVFKLELNYNNSRLLSGKVIFKGCLGACRTFCLAFTINERGSRHLLTS